MERFADRHGPAGVALHQDNGETWLDITEPAMLANFFAFCKTSGRGRGRPVFLRGQHRRHPAMVPSLFRPGSSLASATQRWAAYRTFLQQLPALVQGTRFTRRNFGAVLQHYGFNTPWLDVVDDLHAAIWFALHVCEKDGSQCWYQPSRDPHGWIVVIAVPPNGRLQNLREEQSSRNTRCNVQQGYSLAMQYDDVDMPSADQDFMGRIEGRVRIPNDERWILQGFRASHTYFFPPPEQDDTFKQLLAQAVTRLADRAERTHGLESGSLGRVLRYERE